MQKSEAVKSNKVALNALENMNNGSFPSIAWLLIVRQSPTTSEGRLHAFLIPSLVRKVVFARGCAEDLASVGVQDSVDLIISAWPTFRVTMLRRHLLDVPHPSTTNPIGCGLLDRIFFAGLMPPDLSISHK
jgi:hypothetical protein